MEDQFDTPDEGNQQIPVGTVPVSSPQPVQTRSKIILPLVTFVVLIVSALTYNFLFKKPESQILPDNIQPPQTSDTNLFTVTGVIRTDGLSEEEKLLHELSDLKYQVTDFPTVVSTASANSISGYFLVTDTIDDSYLGQCASISGVVPDNWKNPSPNQTYGRSVIVVSSIQKLNYSDCHPFSGNVPWFDETMEKKSLTGKLSHNARPAPDINYDYHLELNEGFLDEDSEAGGPAMRNSLILIPQNDSDWILLQNNIDKEITVEGYMVWGYAESRHFEIVSISN